NPISNRKERTGLLLPLLPPARFSWSTVLLPHALILASACVHQLGAHPATGGTRKLSAPGPVHSIPKSCGSQEPSLAPDSNPFLADGRSQNSRSNSCSWSWLLVPETFVSRHSCTAWP